jgi:hypothetical protein
MDLQNWLKLVKLTATEIPNLSTEFRSFYAFLIFLVSYETRKNRKRLLKIKLE